MRPKWTAGLTVSLVLLGILALAPFVSSVVFRSNSLEIRAVSPSFMWAMVGVLVSAGLATLLVILRRMWVLVAVVLWCVVGIGYNLMHMMRFRELTGEWGWHPEVWGFMLIIALLYSALIVAVLTPSSRRSLRDGLGAVDLDAV